MSSPSTIGAYEFLIIAAALILALPIRLLAAEDDSAVLPKKDSSAEVHSEANSKDVELVATYTIKLHVTGEQNGETRPIQSANIELLVVGTDFLRKRRTDAKGNAEFEAVPDGTVKIRVFGTGWEAQVKELVADGEPKNLEFVLGKLQPPHPVDDETSPSDN